MAAVDWLPCCQGRRFLVRLGFSFDLWILPFVMSVLGAIRRAAGLYDLPSCSCGSLSSSSCWPRCRGRGGSRVMATPKDRDLPYRREAALRPVTAGTPGGRPGYAVGRAARRGDCVVPLRVYAGVA
jgi:hypothetical protein